MGNLLAYQRVGVAVLQIDNGVLHRLGIDIVNLHRHLTASQLLTENGSLLQGIDDTVGVNATLKAERCVSRKAMTTGRLTNPRGMKVSRLQHDAVSGLIGAAALTAKDACYAHGLLGVADGKVTVRQFVLHTVERLEGRALRHGLHHNLVAGHHVSIETVKRLSVGHHHVVGNIHNIIDGAQPYRGQLVLQPVG